MWSLIVFSTNSAVPSDRFVDALRKQRDITMNAEMTKAPEDLTLTLRLRFPKQTFGGSTGSMDRSDVYVLSSESGDIECTAQVRGDSVCHVTLKGRDGTDSLKATIQELFPGLTVD